MDLRPEHSSRNKILIINGPNINMLGIREPDIYGRKTYSDLCGFIRDTCASRGLVCELFQSNHEGEIVDRIQAAYGDEELLGIVINPAAYTHTSIAIPDALKAVGIPAVEVHLSDISAREEYRRVSFTSEAAVATFKGYGFDSYRMAVDLLAGGAKNGSDEEM